MSRKAAKFEDLPDVLTVPEIARFLDVGRQAVYQKIREGRLPAMHFGRVIRISKKAFGAVLERGELLSGDIKKSDADVGAERVD